MRVYLGKQRIMTSTGVTATHGTVLQLVQKVGVVHHKIFIDNSPHRNFSVIYNNNSMALVRKRTIYTTGK
jgi:hypothetical protein